MDEHELREVLQELCAGRTTFPTWTEFEQAGRRGLRKTVDQHGGARRWAAELGLQISRPGPKPGSGGAPRQPNSPTRLAAAEASARAQAKANERARLQAQALEMRRDGLPVAAIARELGTHFTTVHAWLRRTTGAGG